MRVSPATTGVSEPVLVATEVEREPATESGGDIFALFERSSALESSRPEHARTGVLNRVRPDWRDQVFGLLSPSGHSNRFAGGRSNRFVSSGSTTTVSEGRAALLQALLASIVVVVLAVWAYYAYRPPLGDGAWLHAPRSGTEPASISSPTQSAIDVSKTSAPEPAQTPQSALAVDEPKAPSEAQSRPDINLPSGQGQAPSDASAGTGEVSEAPTDRLATPAEAPGAAQGAVAPATPTNATDTSATHPRTTGPGGRQGTRRAASTRPPLESAGAIVPAAPGDRASRGSLRTNPRITECTEAVAALGFCSRPVTEDR